MAGEQYVWMAGGLLLIATQIGLFMWSMRRTEKKAAALKEARKQKEKEQLAVLEKISLKAQELTEKVVKTAEDKGISVTLMPPKENPTPARATYWGGSFGVAEPGIPDITSLLSTSIPAMGAYWNQIRAQEVQHWMPKDLTGRLGMVVCQYSALNLFSTIHQVKQSDRAGKTRQFLTETGNEFYTYMKETGIVESEDIDMKSLFFTLGHMNIPRDFTTFATRRK